MPARKHIPKKALLKIPKLLKEWKTHKQIAREIKSSASVVRRILNGEDTSRGWPEFDVKLEEALRYIKNYKRCSKCSNVFPRSSDFFQKNSASRLDSHCLECKRRRNRDRFRNIRQEVLLHYSNGNLKCACCGEEEPPFLTIDHIDGGGSQHRKELKKINCTNINVWLKNEGFPTGYRVLCMNCNSALGLHEYCPHQKEGISNLDKEDQWPRD